jgi:protein-S-isoprenylcysteine O-methyltransferase Ste14
MPEPEPTDERLPSAAWSLAKTLVEIILLWSTFLFALPIGISIVEIDMGLQRFPPQPAIAGVLLMLFTAIGLWAVVVLAVRGRGTPLPFDPPRRLVIEGPYGHLRNPLAAATLGQATAIALALGSVPVTAYVLVAALVWHFVIRPREEATLEQRFGAGWRRYTRNVHAWRPRLTRYEPRWTDRGGTTQVLR